MQYQRFFIRGGVYFFTVVTFQRHGILCLEENIQHLRDALKYAKKKHPFIINAIVILPDHFHCILTLPEDDSDFPTRIRLTKTYFSRRITSTEEEDSNSRTPKKEKAVWQRRYWEHAIRDDDDFRRHVEYIHYNPVKHGLASAPREWKYSSFHTYVDKGIYKLGWGDGDAVQFEGDMKGE